MRSRLRDGSINRRFEPQFSRDQKPIIEPWLTTVPAPAGNLSTTSLGTAEKGCPLGPWDWHGLIHRDSSDSWLVDAMSSTPYWRYEIHYPILSRSSVDPHSPKEPKDPKQPKTVKRLFCQQIVEYRQPFFQILSKFGVSRVSSLVVVGRSRS